MDSLYPKSFLRLVLLGFLLVALPLMLTIGYAVYGFQQQVIQSELAVQRASHAARAGRQLAESLLGMERLLRQYAVVAEPQLIEDYRRTRNEFRQVSSEFSAISLESAQRGRLADVVAQEARIFARLGDGADVDAETLVEQLQFLAEDALPVVEAARAIADREIERLQQSANRARDAVWMPIAAAVLAALLVAWWFHNLVGRQIRQIRRAIRVLGRAEYDQPIAVDGPEDLAILGQRLDWLRQRLAELEQQKSRFLSHVSHDLKTPLTALKEGVQLLADGVPGPLLDSQRRIVGILSQNTARLQTLIEGLLDFQQASHAAANLDLQPVALDRLADEVLRGQKLVAEARSVRFRKALLPVSVVGDPEKLRLVIENLVTNAVKFAPEKGNVSLSLKAEAGAAVLEVEDDGPGIAEAERDKIFDPFFRGTRPREGKIEGSGLGLAIAREYVMAHGGRIELVSPPGAGARFRVTIPLPQQESQA